MEFPLGLFGIALATVTLPYLSRQAATNSMQEFSATLDWSMKLICLIAVPAAIGLIVLAEPLITTIFYGGEFSQLDVELSALSLQAFAIGLVGFSFVKILAPAYFAREDTKTPVRVGLIALLVNLVLSVIFALVLTRISFAGTHAGLALAISIAALVNAWLLYRGLRREQLIKHSPGWVSMLTRFVIGNVAMTMSIVALNRPLDWWLEAAISQRSGWLGIVVGTAAAVYFGVLLVVGVRPGHLSLNKR